MRAASIIIAVCCMVAACSGTRRTVVSTATEQRDTMSFATVVDTMANEAYVATEARDTMTGTDRVRGYLHIERDTAGRPVIYAWEIDRELSKISALNTAANRSEATSSRTTAARRHTATESVATLDERTETRRGVPLETWVGGGILLLTLICTTIICIKEAWNILRQ